MAGSSDKPIPVPSPTGMWQDAHRQIPAVKDGDPVGYVAAMTPLERAARALEQALHDWLDNKPPYDCDEAAFGPLAARAVLAAIREPSDLVWQDMIDAALAEEG